MGRTKPGSEKTACDSTVFACGAKLRLPQPLPPKQCVLITLLCFVSACCCCSRCPSGYSGFPVSEVHKIAVLDLRLANADRNAGNILARRKPDGSGGETWELIPIDHGYCLPASFEDLSYEWMYW